jgi:hypothetical protein
VELPPSRSGRAGRHGEHQECWLETPKSSCASSWTRKIAERYHHPLRCQVDLRPECCAAASYIPLQAEIATASSHLIHRYRQLPISTYSTCQLIHPSPADYIDIFLSHLDHRYFLQRQLPARNSGALFLNRARQYPPQPLASLVAVAKLNAHNPYRIHHLLLIPIPSPPSVAFDLP